MAVFCLAVLLVALGIAALLSLPQWGEDSVIPEVSVAPGPGVGLGDAVVVSPPRRLPSSSSRPARPAIGEGRLLAARTPDGAGPGQGAVAVEPAQVASRPVGNKQTEPSQQPQEPEPGPTQQPASVPVATPVSVPSPAAGPPSAAPTRPGFGGQPTRPGSAGGPGPGGGPITGPVEIYDGDEYAYSFSFCIQPDAYRLLGEDNLILRFADEAGEAHSLGLQLWDDGSGDGRGLWASGDAMGGERFLAPVAEGVWHEVVLYFEASTGDDGLYLLLLDGEPIDTRAWVSLIDSEASYGLLEAGLVREGERIEADPEISFGPARLYESLEPVIP